LLAPKTKSDQLGRFASWELEEKDVIGHQKEVR
jgi:hypothetical protein